MGIVAYREIWLFGVGRKAKPVSVYSDVRITEGVLGEKRLIKNALRGYDMDAVYIEHHDHNILSLNVYMKDESLWHVMLNCNNDAVNWKCLEAYDGDAEDSYEWEGWKSVFKR